MPILDPYIRRARDRERVARRAAERKAQGLCPRCGVRPAWERPRRVRCLRREAPGSERVRDARRRAAGIHRRRNVAAEGARDRQRTAERIARGVCTKCGACRPEAGRRLCGACAAKRREADRLRYRKARDAGLKYGGRPVDGKRRREPNLCTRCGRRPPVEGGGTCAACRTVRQAAEREKYRARRAQGLCVACGRRPSPARRAAACARPWKASTATGIGRTPPRGAGTGPAGRPAAVRTATGRASEHRGVRPAPSARTSAPITCAACWCIRRASR